MRLDRIGSKNDTSLRQKLLHSWFCLRCFGLCFCPTTAFDGVDARWPLDSSGSELLGTTSRLKYTRGNITMPIRDTTFGPRNLGERFGSSTLSKHGGAKAEKRQQTRRERLMKQIQEQRSLSKASMAYAATSLDSYSVKQCTHVQSCNCRGLQHKKINETSLQEPDSPTLPTEDVDQLSEKNRKLSNNEAQNLGSKHEDPRPWETLVLGANLGDNLSRIEQKDREILQQRFILEWCLENEPDSIGHQEKILHKRIHERTELEDNEENSLPRYATPFLVSNNSIHRIVVVWYYNYRVWLPCFSDIVQIISNACEPTR
jgi:hypothetical protein